MSSAYSFQAKIRLRQNENKPGSWHFVTLPGDVASHIKEQITNLPKRGRKSIKVTARIAWLDRETSIFPDAKRGSYLLPIKANIRKQLEIGEGDKVHIDLTCHS